MCGRWMVARSACQMAKQHIGVFCKTVSHGLLNPSWSKWRSALPNPERVVQNTALNVLTIGC